MFLKAQAKFSLEAYAYYIAGERRVKKPDLFIIRGLYERAIAEAARRRFVGEAGAEEALRSFWGGYCDALVCLGLSLVGVELLIAREVSAYMGYMNSSRMRR